MKSTLVPSFWHNKMFKIEHNKLEGIQVNSSAEDAPRFYSQWYSELLYKQAEVSTCSCTNKIKKPKQMVT